MVLPARGDTLLDFDPVEVARQLTAMDYEMFVNIKPSECFEMVWKQKTRHKRAPDLVAMIER